MCSRVCTTCDFFQRLQQLLPHTLSLKSASMSCLGHLTVCIKFFRFSRDNVELKVDDMRRISMIISIKICRIVQKDSKLSDLLILATLPIRVFNCSNTLTYCILFKILFYISAASIFETF